MKKMRHLKCNVKDVNHIEVNDKNNPSKIYKTNISFICWYPSDKFDKKYIDANGYSKVSNITCFMTDKNGCLMQNPFYRDCYGYIIDEFQTNGVFMSDSMSNNGVEILPGQRAQVIDKDKPSNGKKKNPYNILKHHSPIKKLVEKTMRYYLNNKNNNHFSRESGEMLFAKNIGNNAEEYNLKQKGHLIFDFKNKKTLMTHNDIVLDKSVPAKISNFIIHHNCQFSFDKAKDVIDICKNTLKKNYVYLYSKELKLQKINFALFLKRNLINYLNLQEDKKQEMIENFNKQETRYEIFKKLFLIRYKLGGEDMINNNIDAILKCEDKDLKDLFINKMQSNIKQKPINNNFNIEEIKSNNKKLYCNIQKVINNKLHKVSFVLNFSNDKDFSTKKDDILKYIEYIKQNMKIDKIISKIIEDKKNINNELDNYYTLINKIQQEETNKIITQLFSNENIHTRRINFSSPKNLSNFVLTKIPSK